MAEPRKYPPRCRYCGGLIRKATTILFFKPERTDNDHESGYFEYSYGPLPRTRAEAQRRTNKTVMSASRARDREFIDRVTVWDGQSYVDEFFCNGDHAKRFAYVMARAGQQTKAYHDAMIKAQPEAERL